MSRRKRGFSIVEALIALLILSMLGTTLSLVHHQAISRIAQGEGELEAIRLIEALTLRIGAEYGPAPGDYRGAETNGFTWTLKIAPPQGVKSGDLVEASIAVKRAEITRSMTILKRVKS
jgi:Tfp pilus assembly protein PilV